MTQFINHATEYNELLAEFMELPKPPQNGIGWYDASDLTYDTLWDSQIPVFRKSHFIAILETPRQELAEEVGKFSLGFVEVHFANIKGSGTFEMY